MRPLAALERIRGNCHAPQCIGHFFGALPRIFSLLDLFDQPLLKHAGQLFVKLLHSLDNADKDEPPLVGQASLQVGANARRKIFRVKVGLQRVSILHWANDPLALTLRSASRSSSSILASSAEAHSSIAR